IEDNKEAHEALLHFFARQVGDPISDIAYERTMTWALKDLVPYGNDAIRAASLTVLEDETLLDEAHRVDAALRACADIVDQYYNSSHQAEIVSDTLDSITRILSASKLEGFDSHTAEYIERRLEDARLRISYDAFFNDSPQEGEDLTLLEQKLEAVMAQFRAKVAPAAEAAPAPAP
ncbi:MAG TPA: hypothetical protein PLO23_07170, partial [Alphaproteobacteria bacterium]|nr:hypothetical protein [Alphaproteobacteria bacterium]